MTTKNSVSTAVTTMSKKLMVLINGLLLAFTLFYIPQSFATFNAKGIAIEIVDAPRPEQYIGFNPSKEKAPEQLGLVETNLWQRIYHHYAMPDVASRYTAKYETWYAARPNYIEQMLNRSEKYLFHIVEEVEKRGMPSEIALLPMIESAFKPKAYSRSHAAGIWQFIPSTGTYFGLNQNWWVDNRRNITASTTAALDYLEKLYAMFGSWDLALAAYNAGEGTVGRAIARNEKRNLPTDYKNLKLPIETIHYVPKLQAIKNILTEPGKFGININPIANQAYFTETAAPKQIDAKLIAQFAEISDEEFVALNPSYNLPVIASKNSYPLILLPVNSIDRFQINLINYEQPLTTWQTYNAKRGEHLKNIAKKFKINLVKLKKINDLKRTKTLANSRPLLVPNNNDSEANFLIANLEYKARSAYKRRTAKHITYKVKKGDTISALANKFRMKTRHILKINRLKTSKIKIGQLIKVNNTRYASKRR